MQTDAPMFLVAELAVHDWDKLREYADRVMPLMGRYGGRVIGFSHPRARTIEGDWHPDLVVLHRWRSERDFDAFWVSEEYQPIKQLRLESCDSKIVVFEAPPARGAASTARSDGPTPGA